MADRTKILLADDSNVVTTVLATALKREGFTIDIAVDGQTAIRKAKPGTWRIRGVIGGEMTRSWGNMKRREVAQLAD